MRTLPFLKLLLPALLIFGGAAAAKAQDNTQSSENNLPAAQQQQKRPNLFQELGLSADQRRQIKLLNQENKPSMQAAQQRQREANQKLDEAIYADNVSEADIQARLKDVQNAHSEVLKLRTSSETAVRRILTPDQLVKFRQIRQQFELVKENIQKKRQAAAENTAPANPQPNRQLRRQRMRILNNMHNTQ